ncbi:MAG TPA: GreA/GreB family elongation factor [Flavobacterium sp.]|nr:GreA/GreB family elongation factor [Flavobacterium sp.]
MQQVKERIILRRKNYDLLVKYTFSRLTPLSNDNKNAEQLYEELKQAEVIDNEVDFPIDVIGINSTVEVEERISERKMIFTIVLPSEANISKHRLSVFAPLGIALMGYMFFQPSMPEGQYTTFINVNLPSVSAFFSPVSTLYMLQLKVPFTINALL